MGVSDKLHDLEAAVGGKLEGLEGAVGDAAGTTWMFMTEVKDSVADKATAQLESSMGDLSGMAFSFLKLSDAMVSTLKVPPSATALAAPNAQRLCSLHATGL